jgi:RNA polymerase sigma-70 factor, ECF subfamily
MSPGNVDGPTLKQAQRGVPAAQTAFLREVGDLVASLVRRLGAKGEAEDQLHDVFLHLLAVLPRFDPNGSAKLSTWVFTVTQRWLLMQRRKIAPTLVALDGGLVSNMSTHDGATDYVQGRQLMALLERELERLPEEQRRAFVLTQLHAQPLQAVADAGGVPLATLKTRLLRARAQLVLRLGPLLNRVTPAAGGAHAARR